MESPEPAVGLDVQLDVLSNARRRSALAVLARTEPPVTIRDVTNEVATAEYDAPLDEVPSEAVTRIYARFAHVHVPLLVETDVIDYDPDRRRIEDVSLERLSPALPAVLEIDPGTEPELLERPLE